MKKIKSLVFDLDGTAVISRPDGMPSQTVIDAVRKAKQVCHVSIATGRTLEMSREIWQALEIEDLCILKGGAQLYSPQTREFIWKQEVETVVLQQLFSKLKEFRQYKVAYEKKPVPINLDKFIISEEAGLTLIFETQESDAQKIATIV
jgi:hydroxymethylpyrimidine pyrophosphatase-like HAD family hydrolase